jgi:hypothetical protein
VQGDAGHPGLQGGGRENIGWEKGGLTPLPPQKMETKF